jgi:hypothetical protein
VGACNKGFVKDAIREKCAVFTSPTKLLQLIKICLLCTIIWGQFQEGNYIQTFHEHKLYISKTAKKQLPPL